MWMSGRPISTQVAFSSFKLAPGAANERTNADLNALEPSTLGNRLFNSNFPCRVINMKERSANARFSFVIYLLVASLCSLFGKFYHSVNQQITQTLIGWLSLQEKMSFPQPPTRSFVSASLGWYNIGVSSHKQSSICGFTPDREATRIIKNGKLTSIITASFHFGVNSFR